MAVVGRESGFANKKPANLPLPPASIPHPIFILTYLHTCTAAQHTKKIQRLTQPRRPSSRPPPIMETLRRHRLQSHARPPLPVCTNGCDRHGRRPLRSAATAPGRRFGRRREDRCQVDGRRREEASHREDGRRREDPCSRRYSLKALNYHGRICRHLVVRLIHCYCVEAIVPELKGASERGLLEDTRLFDYDRAASAHYGHFSAILYLMLQS